MSPICVLLQCVLQFEIEMWGVAHPCVVTCYSVC